MNKAGEFLGNVKTELQKVTWPTRKETYGTTVVVVVLVLLVCRSHSDHRLERCWKGWSVRARISGCGDNQ